MCDNCKLLQDRIVALKADIDELEDRRSRERVRFINEQQRMFFHKIENEKTQVDYKQNCFDLLDLVQMIVKENPNLKSIDVLRDRIANFQI